MAHDYDRMNKMVRRHKSALTRAKNQKDNKKIIAVCDAAFAEFDLPENIWPDNWHDWNVAKEDAELALQRENHTGHFQRI